jgi:hypothetical protein
MICRDILSELRDFAATGQNYAAINTLRSYRVGDHVFDRALDSLLHDELVVAIDDRGKRLAVGDAGKRLAVNLNSKKTDEIDRVIASGGWYTDIRFVITTIVATAAVAVALIAALVHH